MLADYPAAARAAGVEGAASIACSRIAEGAPDACTVIAESPLGQGFGAAALRLAARAPRHPERPSLEQKPPWRLDFKFKLKPEPAITPDVIAGPHVSPHIEKHPTDDALLDAYPLVARQTGIPGLVILVCVITADGHMSKCDAKATPTRFGFERAALSLAGTFQVRPYTDDGAPTVGTTIAIPIYFALP
jgi:TonB family protein